MWEFESKSWKKRCEDLKIGTPEAVSSLGRHQNEGGGDARTRVRAAPSLEPWDVIRGLETAVEHLHLPRTHDWERRARVNTWSAGLIVQAGVYSMHHLMPPCVPNTCGNDLIPALNIRELERHSGSGHVIARRCEFTPGKGEHMRTRAPPADRPM